MNTEEIINLIKKHLQQATNDRERYLNLMQEAESHDQRVTASIDVIDAVGRMSMLRLLLREIITGK